ncbi:MAG: peptidoglycan-binding protein [Propionibacteriaceae bacterium]
MRKIFTKVTATAAGLALAVGFTALATPSAEAAGCTTTFSSYRAISKHSTGSQAKAAECLLRAAGYKPNVNGRFWDADVAAAKKFQRAKGISATGTVGKATWTALLSRGSTPRLKPGNRGSSVRRLQQALRASGRSVSVNGVYDARTKAAVRSYQSYQHGWKATGTAGAKTWSSLQHGRLGSAPKVSSSSTKGAKALAFAKKQLGDSYRFGATGPNSWDCSGLTGGAWKAAGVKLPRTSQAQYRAGRAVSKSNLRAGDLVFFYSGRSHVAIYAGGGKVIHASKPGTPVQYIKMSYMPYAGARRPA